MDRRLSSILSLSRRAGALALGGEACEKAIRTKKALLVIVCSDASDSTKKKFIQKTFYYNIPYVEALARDELSRAAGIGGCTVAAVTDTNFSGRIKELIEDNKAQDDFKRTTEVD